MLARFLAAPHKEHGPEKTLKHWKNFLTANEARYISIPKFAETFGAWETATPDAWRKDEREIRPGETVDQYAQRLSYL
jgi:hypothetical protein